MYTLNYDIQGKISSIQKDNMSIPLAEDNSDFQQFLEWNAEQDVPLDLDSTIEVVPPVPARDLAKEIDDMKVKIGNLEKGKVDKV